MLVSSLAAMKAVGNLVALRVRFFLRRLIRIGNLMLFCTVIAVVVVSLSLNA